MALTHQIPPQDDARDWFKSRVLRFADEYTIYQRAELYPHTFINRLPGNTLRENLDAIRVNKANVKRQLKFLNSDSNEYDLDRHMQLLGALIGELRLYRERTKP